MSDKRLPRDVFIDTIYEEATKDRNIFFMSADLGAKALDRFRSDLPDQFIHAGICEQNMMDVAAGLAQNGKNVFCYAMAPFVTLRCFEQIKVALASMDLPVTIIGNGVGYSYNDAGPTHYATEDVSCMRSLAGYDIITVGDSVSAEVTARETCKKAAMRYVRLDRAFLPDVYSADDRRFWTDGLAEVVEGTDAAILANGFTLQQAREVRERLKGEGKSVGIIDVFRVKPIDLEVLKRVLDKYPKVVTYEEHFLSGGTGAAIAEAMMDAGILKPLLRVGIEDHYYLENGGRPYIQKLAGVDVESAYRKIQAFLS